MEDGDRYRLVLLGSSQVGKTSFVRKYLFNSFTDKYKETVEDIFSRNYTISGRTMCLDILDTNFNYPDMRRVSIDHAHAFILFLAIDSVLSFKHASDLLNEICERRQDFEGVPLVVVGNKSDLLEKKINKQTAEMWISRVILTSNKRHIPYYEISAKTGANIEHVFRDLLDQSGFRSGDKSSRPVTGLESADAGDVNSNRPDGRCSALGVDTGGSAQRSRSLRRNKRPGTATAGSTAPESGSDGGETAGAGHTGRSELKKALSQGLTRHGSLMRKTRLSFRSKRVVEDDLPDDSDCKIS